MAVKFMLDIEATGLLFSEDLLQIGVLEIQEKNGYWLPGREFDFYQGTKKNPESEFSKAHHERLYSKCQEVSFKGTDKVREDLLDFFQECGETRPVITGWCVANWDLPFLLSKGYLVLPHYDAKEGYMGDFDYKVDEIEGAVVLLSEGLGIDRETVIERSLEISREKNLFTMPDGQEHDALYDCYLQLLLKNGLLAYMRKFFS